MLRFSPVPFMAVLWFLSERCSSTCYLKPKVGAYDWFRQSLLSHKTVLILLTEILIRLLSVTNFVYTFTYYREISCEIEISQSVWTCLSRQCLIPAVRLRSPKLSPRSSLLLRSHQVGAWHPTVLADSIHHRRQPASHCIAASFYKAATTLTAAK